MTMESQKTEVVVLSKEDVPKVHSTQTGEIMTLSKPTVNYLNIVIDTMMSSFEHTQNIVRRTAGRMFVICPQMDIII